MNTWLRGIDTRSWIGLGSYALVWGVLAMVMADKTLLANDFYKVIATAIILNGWNSGPLAWAFAATKTGGELAQRNADLVQKQAENSPPIDKDKEGV